MEFEILTVYRVNNSNSLLLHTRYSFVKFLLFEIHSATVVRIETIRYESSYDIQLYFSDG